MQWGAWAGAGMAAASRLALARIARSGMGVIAPAAGLAVLQATLLGFGTLSTHGPAALAAQPPAELVSSPFNWARLLRGRRGAMPGIFHEVASAAASPADAADGPAEAGMHGVAAAAATVAGTAVPGNAMEGLSAEEVLRSTAATVHALLGDQVDKTLTLTGSIPGSSKNGVARCLAGITVFSLFGDMQAGQSAVMWAFIWCLAPRWRPASR